MALSPEMKRCIDICLDCYKTCLAHSHEPLPRDGRQARRASALPADDGVRRDVPDLGALHADYVAAPQTHLSGMRGSARSAPRTASALAGCMSAWPLVVPAPSPAAPWPLEASMKSQRIASEGKGETLVVVLDSGEEAFSTLQDFARKEGVSAASLTAIGAFSRATVGWFDCASSVATKRSRSMSSAKS